MKFQTFLLLVGVFCLHVNCDLSKDNQQDDDVFVATKEWQKVREGQSIPSGLHVRMDMTTGGKWAKLMEDDHQDEKPKSSAVLVKTNAPQTDTNSLKDDKRQKGEKLDIEELKKQLANMKSKELNTTQKDKFRSMGEIRADLEDLLIKQESDFVAIKRLLSEAANPKQENLLQVLEDIEFYVHQVDNANDFIKINGIKQMMKLVMNSNQDNIRAHAIQVVGTSAQGNPKVQIRAVELKVVEKLLEILKNKEETLDVRKKSLYTISCILRHFTHAQHVFALNHGFQMLSDLFEENSNSKLLLKAIQLVSDLKLERSEIQSRQVSDEAKEKLKQYNRFNLTDVLTSDRWCEKLVFGLRQPSLALRETTAEAMKNFLDICRNQFNRKPTIQLLINLMMEVCERNEWKFNRASLKLHLNQADAADLLLNLITDDNSLEEFATSTLKIEL